MADEKIVVVCDKNCDSCIVKYPIMYDGCEESVPECPVAYISSNGSIDKGDVVTIEIKRAENK